MKCYYCGGINIKKVAWKGAKVYCIECLDSRKEGNWCRYTTIPQIEKCLICDKEFEFRFDPGWFEEIVCQSCVLKRMKDFFNDPEFKKALQEEIKKPTPEWMKPEGNWTGGFIPVPLNLENAKEHKK